MFPAAIRWALLAWLAGALAGCKESPGPAPPAATAPSELRADADDPVGDLPWFEGGVEAAFEAARRADQPVFLYWGAAWCPPCNEIKRRVFSHPRFESLIDEVVPVYLDGDTPAAQRWGEVFGASGYPTLLLLAPDWRELMRFSGVVDFDEFAEAFEAAVTAARPVTETLELVLGGEGSADDWRLLARLSWTQAPRVELQDEELLAAQKQLADQVPFELSAEAALLSGSLLAAAAAADESSPTRSAVRSELSRHLDRLLAPGDPRFAARVFVLEFARTIVAFAPEARRRAVADRWLEALRSLPDHPRATPDLALDALDAELELAELMAPGEPLASELVERARAVATAAEARADGEYDRHAVVSHAARLLARVGARDAARAMLEDELERTDTPWYVQSVLGQLEADEGDREAALEWARRAAESARGRATRIQWTVDYLRLAADIGAKERVPEILDAYYELAIELPDGFRGRNWLRARQVADAVRPLRGHPEVGVVLGRRGLQCRELPEARRDRCRRHFAAIRSSE